MSRLARLPLAASVLALTLSGAASASVTVVHSAAGLGAATSVITFDDASSSSLAAVAANYGVNLTTATPGTTTFIATPGNYSGIGFLPSNAFGNSMNGLLADISRAFLDDYSGSSFRSFDVTFDQLASRFGLSIQGAGLISHEIDLYDGQDALIAHYSFASAGLPANDTGLNGFVGFISDTAIHRIRFTNDPALRDFVALDNLTFAAAATGVPEPATPALLLAALVAGGAWRRKRAA